MRPADLFGRTAKIDKETHKQQYRLNYDIAKRCPWAAVVAQFVGRSLPNPEVRSLNPIIGKKILNIYGQLSLKDENK